MKTANRYALCAMSWLIASMTIVPTVRAEPDDDIWDLLGSGVNVQSNLMVMVTPRIAKVEQTRQEDEHIWDLMRSDVSGGPEAAIFVFEGDRIFINTGTDRQPDWEPISEKEFWSLIEELENAGFGFVADEGPEKIVVLFIVW